MLTPQESLVLASLLIWVIFIGLTTFSLRKRKPSWAAVLKFCLLAGVVAVGRIAISLYLDQVAYFDGLTNYLPYLLVPEFPVLQLMSIDDLISTQAVLIVTLVFGSVLWILPSILWFSDRK